MLVPYDRIQAVLTCAPKLSEASLIYLTEPEIKAEKIKA